MARSSSKSDASQTKSKSRSRVSAADDTYSSTVILDATPLRPRMMQRLIGAALIMSMVAFTLAVYPIMRPLIGSAFGLAALVPAWQSEISTLRQQAAEYRALAEAERIRQRRSHQNRRRKNLLAGHYRVAKLAEHLVLDALLVGLSPARRHLQHLPILNLTATLLRS